MVEQSENEGLQNAGIPGGDALTPESEANMKAFDWACGLNPKPRFSLQEYLRRNDGCRSAHPTVYVDSDDVDRRKRIEAAAKGIQILGRM